MADTLYKAAKLTLLLFATDSATPDIPINN